MERQKEDIKSGTLGERLALLRKRYGYSQQEIADLLDVTRQTISTGSAGRGRRLLIKRQSLPEYIGSVWMNWQELQGSMRQQRREGSAYIEKADWKEVSFGVSGSNGGCH